MQGKVTVVRLPEELVDELEGLRPRLADLHARAGGMGIPSRSEVIRIVLRRGIDAIKREQRPGR